MRVASLLFSLSVAGFAGTWSGQLVDSRCYASVTTNVSLDAGFVGRDMVGELRRCLVNDRTKNFGVVLNDWSTFHFDARGNAQASELVRLNHKRSAYDVTVGGAMNSKKHTIAVSSLSVKPAQTPLARLSK
jgi:hypothetical protein